MTQYKPFTYWLAIKTYLFSQWVQLSFHLGLQHLQFITDSNHKSFKLLFRQFNEAFPRWFCSITTTRSHLQTSPTKLFHRHLWDGFFACSSNHSHRAMEDLETASSHVSRQHKRHTYMLWQTKYGYEWANYDVIRSHELWMWALFRVLTLWRSIDSRGRRCLVSLVRATKEGNCTVSTTLTYSVT